MDSVVALFVIAAVGVVVATRDVRRWGFLARLDFGVLAVCKPWVSYLSVRVHHEQWFDTLSTPALRAQNDAAHRVPNPKQPRPVSNAFDFTLATTP